MPPSAAPVLTLMDIRCPPEVLESWANSPLVNVQMAIAGNPNCPPKVQIEYAEHRDANIAKRLLANPALYHRALDSLRLREDLGIAKLLVEKYLHTRETLIRYSRSQNTELRLIAAQHSADLGVLYGLCADSSERVRTAAVANVACPSEGKVVAALMR